MSRFGGGLKISKTESPDKTPYTIYYPHKMPPSARQWTQEYYQVVSIDPARKNYALRIERRYHNGWITPVVFDKVSIEAVEEDGPVTISNTYQTLTGFLDTYQRFYDDCHFIIIERQLPQNYKATRIAQHTISYFSLYLHNKPLYPAIVEIDAKLKGRVLGAPRGVNEKQLKPWAVETARAILSLRQDDYSLQILDHFRKKQDDLSDTVCQIEALFLCWGAPPTAAPIPAADGRPVSKIFASEEIVPPIVLPGIGGVPMPPRPKKGRNRPKGSTTEDSVVKQPQVKPAVARAELVKFIGQAPERVPALTATLSTPTLLKMLPAPSASGNQTPVTLA